MDYRLTQTGAEVQGILDRSPLEVTGAQLDTFITEASEGWYLVPLDSGGSMLVQVVMDGPVIYQVGLTEPHSGRIVLRHYNTQATNPAWTEWTDAYVDKLTAADIAFGHVSDSGMKITIGGVDHIVSQTSQPLGSSNAFVAPTWEALTIALETKQDTLTFDTTPTANSTNPVTSGGIKTYVDNHSASVTVDDELSTSSENPVQNKVVTTALNGKQSTLTFDNAPTASSNNPVKSGGVYTALAGKQDTLTFDNAPTASSNNPVKSGGVYTSLQGKQDTISDLATIRSGASAGATAYQKPSGGIPPTDLATAVQTALAAATAAAPQATTYTKTEVNNLLSPINATIVWVASADWPLATGTANTIYCVQGTTSFTAYGWTGSAFQELATYDWIVVNAATENSSDAIASGAVYDILYGSRSTEVTTSYSLSGYIAISNGSVVTGNTWIHSDFIPLADFVRAGVFQNHGSVALIAFYSAADFSTYISGLNGAGYQGQTVSKSSLTIPANANYVVFSTDSSKYTLSVVTALLSGGLIDRINSIESDVDGLDDGIDNLIVNDLTTGGTNKALSAQQGKVLGEVLNGIPAQSITTIYSLSGYIAAADGSIVTGNTWVHSDLIPWSNFVSATKLIFNGSVASVAFYNSNRAYISGINSGTGIPDPTLKASLTPPSGTEYVAFSTNGSTNTLSVTYMESQSGLIDRVEDLENGQNGMLKYTEQTLTPSQQLQARENIGIADAGNVNKYVHFSLDDCTFWADLITNESNYDSCFDNSVLGRLKEFHDAYGHCYTLNCFIVSGAASIADVPSKWAAEFQANKDWLRFAFHGTDTEETFGSTTPEVLLGYYNTFVTAIHTMTGTYECIDKVTRLSSYTGNASNIAAIRDAKCGITGLLTNDRDVLLSAGSSYYLDSTQNGYMHTHDKMYDGTNMLWFFRTQRRLENDTIAPSALASLDWANFTPFIEIFWHETTGWSGSYAFTTWLKPWFDYLKENGYQNAFTADVMKIN